MAAVTGSSADERENVTFVKRRAVEHYEVGLVAVTMWHSVWPERYVARAIMR